MSYHRPVPTVRASRRPRRAPVFRPALEVLESRQLLAVTAVGDLSVADFRAGTPDGSAVVSDAAAGVTLSPPGWVSFAGPGLPAGWTATTLAAGGSAAAASGTLTVDGALAGGSALAGPGSSV